MKIIKFSSKILNYPAASRGGLNHIFAKERFIQTVSLIKDTNL